MAIRGHEMRVEAPGAPRKGPWLSCECGWSLDLGAAATIEQLVDYQREHANPIAAEIGKRNLVGAELEVFWFGYEQGWNNAVQAARLPGFFDTVLKDEPE